MKFSLKIDRTPKKPMLNHFKLELVDVKNNENILEEFTSCIAAQAHNRLE